MTTQTSNTLSSSFSASDNILLRLLSWLVKPAEGLEIDDRQTASFLLTLTLIFFPLGSAVVFSTPIIDMLNGQSFIVPNIGGIFGLVITISAYGLGRTKHYRMGSYLIVIMPFVAVLSAGITAEILLPEVALLYLALSFILSSLLLSSQATFITGILTVCAVILLYFLKVDATTEFPYLVILFMAIVIGILTFTSRIREQNMEKLIVAQKELNERIIETQEALEKAERSDQVKSAFLASMSHELRTPLNAIINFTRFVVKGTLGAINEEQVETLGHVVSSGKHLLNLINDVLDMSKIESGSLNLFVSDDVDLQNIINDVSTTAKALLKEEDVVFKVDVDEALPLMRGDQQRIRQILLNLVSNACKFTEEGEITISATQEKDDIVLIVTDTGPGIAIEDQSLVFESFKQTTSGLRQGGGTGLGMPITKSLVEAHGGSIHLESDLGQGTTFDVRLPIKSNILTPTLITEF